MNAKKKEKEKDYKRLVLNGTFKTRWLPSPTATIG